MAWAVACLACSEPDAAARARRPHAAPAEPAQPAPAEATSSAPLQSLPPPAEVLPAGPAPEPRVCTDARDALERSLEADDRILDVLCLRGRGVVTAAVVGPPEDPEDPDAPVCGSHCEVVVSRHAEGREVGPPWRGPLHSPLGHSASWRVELDGDVGARVGEAREILHLVESLTGLDGADYEEHHLFFDASQAPRLLMELEGTAVIDSGCDCLPDDDFADTDHGAHEERAEVDVAWSGTRGDFMVTREFFHRSCARDVHPVHRRSPSGNCIQEQTFAWSEHEQRWLPYRGVAAASFMIVGAHASSAERLAPRAEALAVALERERVPIVRSESVPGLRPGLFIAPLGACTVRAEAEAALDAMPAEVKRTAYTRGIGAELSAYACPRPAEGGSP